MPTGFFASVSLKKIVLFSRRQIFWNLKFYKFDLEVMFLIAKIFGCRLWDSLTISLLQFKLFPYCNLLFPYSLFKNISLLQFNLTGLVPPLFSTIFMYFLLNSVAGVYSSLIIRLPYIRVVSLITTVPLFVKNGLIKFQNP